MKRIAPEWLEVLQRLGVREQTAEVWAEIFAAVIDDDTFSAGASELPVFLGQVLHESNMLEHLEECLDYSAPRLMKVWPRRFPTIEVAQQYAHNPQALAERVYGGRMGNTDAGMAWDYRGSGLLQITGYNNFALVQRATGCPVLEQPDRLRQASVDALRAAIALWEKMIPDAIEDDEREVTRLVNGGELGLAERERLTDEARELLT